jgi:uncharacterized protein involved in exopolysaccharide biosynthesis
MRTFLWRYIDDFQLCVFSAKSPSNEDWDAMSETFFVKPRRGVLGYTLGGAPNALQRKKVRDLHNRSGSVQPPSAILTTSMIARAAVTALNLFLDNKFRAYPPSEINEALLFLQTPKEIHAPMKIALDELSQELGVTPQHFQKIADHQGKY